MVVARNAIVCRAAAWSRAESKRHVQVRSPGEQNPELLPVFKWQVHLPGPFGEGTTK